MAAVTAVVVAYQGRNSSLPLPGSLQPGKQFSKRGALFRLFLRHILFCLQEELLFPFQQRFPLFLVSPTGKHVLQAFHHRLNDRQVIDHDVRLREAKLDCWAKRSTPIHTHSLHRIGIAEPFQHSRDVFEFASRTHFSHLTGIQIAYNRVRAMAFPRSTLVTSQKTRRMEGLIFLHRQSCALDFLGGTGFKAVLHHMMTHPTSFGHMRYGLDRGLFVNHLSEAFRRPAFLSTSGIWLGNTFLARQASASAFWRGSIRLDGLAEPHRVSFSLVYHGSSPTFFGNEGQLPGWWWRSPRLEWCQSPAILASERAIPTDPRARKYLLLWRLPLWYAGLARLVLPDLSVFRPPQFNDGQAISSLFLASFSYVSPQRLESLISSSITTCGMTSESSSLRASKSNRAMKDGFPKGNRRTIFVSSTMITLRELLPVCYLPL